MADTPAPNRANLPDTTIGPAARPAPAAPPIAQGPAPEVLPLSPTSPAVRPGAAPADTPTQAVIRAERVATGTPGEAEPAGLSTDQVMPTCMITVTLIGVAILALVMLGWMIGAFGPVLGHIFQG